MTDPKESGQPNERTKPDGVTSSAETNEGREDGQQVRNVHFNPSWTEGALAMVCNAQAEKGFALLRLVPWTQHDAVAVFVKPADHEVEHG